MNWHFLLCLGQGATGKITVPAMAPLHVFQDRLDFGCYLQSDLRFPCKPNFRNCLHTWWFLYMWETCIGSCSEYSPPTPTHPPSLSNSHNRPQLCRIVSVHPPLDTGHYYGMQTINVEKVQELGQLDNAWAPWVTEFMQMHANTHTHIPVLAATKNGCVFVNVYIHILRMCQNCSHTWFCCRSNSTDTNTQPNRNVLW